MRVVHQIKALAVAGLLALVAPLPTLAECVEAEATPVVPDGNTATREDMLAATKAIKAYNAAVEEYVKCLRKNGGNTARENRAVDKLNTIATQFNAAVRDFKKKAGG